MKYLNTYDNTTVPVRSDTLLGVDNPGDPAWAVKQFTVENLDKALETVQAVTASTAATSVDLSVARNVVVTLQADTEITFSNVPYPASGRITLEQDVAGGWGVTWANEILWLNSTPTIGSAAFGRYVVRWWTDEDAQVYAEYAGDAFAGRTVTSSVVKIATKDGEAMVFLDDGTDLSSYAGTDSGDTPFKLTFTDSGGKTAMAYAGAAGGGETYDVELFDNAGLEDGIENWSAFDATISQDASVFRSGAYSVKVVASADQGRAYRVFADLSTGSLYNCSGYVKNVAGGQSRITFSSYISSPLFGDYSAAFQFSYVTFNATSSALIVRVVNKDLGGVAYGDDFSLKKFTDVAETGLHLISSPNGTTRNMASVETGFNPNAITEIDIERVE